MGSYTRGASLKRARLRGVLKNGGMFKGEKKEKKRRKIREKKETKSQLNNLAISQLHKSLTKEN